MLHVDVGVLNPLIYDKDIQLGEKLGVPGTPFFVINSPTLSGVVQLEDIESILVAAK